MPSGWFSQGELPVQGWPDLSLLQGNTKPARNAALLAGGGGGWVYHWALALGANAASRESRFLGKVYWNLSRPLGL